MNKVKKVTEDLLSKRELFKIEYFFQEKSYNFEY